MRLTWYGHACFHITGNGLRIVTDPYTPHVAGLAPVAEPAEIVIMSSDCDRFHSDFAQVPGAPTVLNALTIAREGGSRDVHGLRIDAIEARESDTQSKPPRPNGMYAFTLDGVRVVHMGDIGNPLTPEQLAFLNGVDVLLALTGAIHTLSLRDLDQAIKAVNPRLVIPMHYQIPNLKMRVLPLEAFTRRHPREIVEVSAETTLDVTPDTLPREMRIVALQPAANLAKGQPPARPEQVASAGA